MKLADARRVALFSYNSEKKMIEFRHYTITVAPVGVSKTVKKLIQTDIPDLSQAKDISEYILRGAVGEESDAEEAEDSKVELPQRYLGRGNIKSSQRAIKLVEIGPRLDMKLVKVQKDLCGGEVIFHDYSAFPCHRCPFFWSWVSDSLLHVERSSQDARGSQGNERHQDEEAP